MDEEKKIPVLNKKIESSFQKRKNNNRMIIFVVIILAILGVFYLLFSYVKPVVGTVNDANSLAEQQKFFINSQNGDKVLIYQDKAIIYRPSENKLINVGPVYIDSTSTEDNIN